MDIMAADISAIFGMSLLELVEHMYYAQLGIMIAIAVSATVTGGFSLWNICLTRKAAERQANLDSCRTLHDMFTTTSQFRDAMDHLIYDTVTEKDHGDLVRLMTYLTHLAICREDKVVQDKYVKTIYGPILGKLTDEKIKEIVGEKYAHLIDADPSFYRRLRSMRDELV